MSGAGNDIIDATALYKYLLLLLKNCLAYFSVKIFKYHVYNMYKL